MSSPQTAPKVIGSDQTQRRAGAESARRVLQIMLCYNGQNHTYSARELAQKVNIPLPSLHRYVALLRETGILIDRGAGKYSLSPRMIPLAQAARSAETIIDIADPIMRRLSSETGETVILVRLVNDMATCTHRIESPQRLRISYEPGQLVPLISGASSKILLGTMSFEARRAHLTHHLKLAGKSLDKLEQLERDIQHAIENGWASSASELDDGIWAVAAAVKHGREVVASLSIPSPISRATPEVRKRLLTQVRLAAADISTAISELH